MFYHCLSYGPCTEDWGRFLGFILGIVFTKTRSIWPVIASHFLFDFFSAMLRWFFLVMF
ncbi:MAG: type II CAAX prenyl endopeptidase Rce1 family protein [Promethearchaeota archaeon]